MTLLHFLNFIHLFTNYVKTFLTKYTLLVEVVKDVC